MNSLGVMQGRLLPKYKNRYQAHPLGYWENEFEVASRLNLQFIEFIFDYNEYELNPLYSKLGIDLFLDELGLNGIQNKNELEQIDMIIEFLKNKDLNHIRNLFIEKTPILKENKQKLIKHYCKIMNEINKLL